MQQLGYAIIDSRHEMAETPLFYARSGDGGCSANAGRAACESARKLVKTRAEELASFTP